MKYITLTAIVLMISIGNLLSQNTELEDVVRISSDIPELQLYDSAIDNRVEGRLRGTQNDIRLEALIDDLVFIAEDDIFMLADTFTFGLSNTRRTDFTFNHALGGVGTNGLTIENTGANNN